MFLYQRLHFICKPCLMCMKASYEAVRERWHRYSRAGHRGRWSSAVGSVGLMWRLWHNGEPFRSKVTGLGRAEGGCIAIFKIKHFLWVMGGQICPNTDLNTCNHKHTLTFRWIQVRGYIIALFSSNSLFQTKYISLNDLNH